MIYADLHIHTVYSPDSLVQPKTLVDLLASHNFIKVAAVTDHDSVRGCKITRQLASSYPDILIIPGVEISTPLGDMLVLGTEELPTKPWDPEQIVDFAKSIGAISVAAHPFRLYGMGESARNYRIDAIEVLNGGSTTKENNQAKELAKNLKIPGTAGSDAHQVSDLFSVCSSIEASLSVESVLDAIRKGMVKTMQTNASIHL